MARSDISSDVQVSVHIEKCVNPLVIGYFVWLSVYVLRPAPYFVGVARVRCIVSNRRSCESGNSARGTELMEQAEREIREVLNQRQRSRRRVDSFTIQNQADLLATEREAARSLTLLIGSVAGVALLAGGIGILPACIGY